MDYAGLDARSDLLAHALLEHRAGPGTSVLTALSSPAEFAVACLAIAKTGAACLPADPAQELPETLRPVVMLLDETADWLLPAVPGAARLVRDPSADLLPADGRWPVSDADRVRPQAPGDPVMLAPGADGTVVIGAESVLAATVVAEPADAAWLVQGYPDVDAALGLLGTLASGRQVHVPDASLARAVPHEVLRWLGEHGAGTVLGGADDTLAALVALARSQGTALTVSGGWAEGRLVVEHTPGGPVPSPGHRAYVLDAALRPVAAGAVGALYIAGAGVAQGYADAPGTTGERFLPDPFGGPDGSTARMWRTCRAARMDTDGGLEVLDGPSSADDPFTDEFATFVVVADGTGHRALWPASAAVPEGWHETHAEDLYELCLDHLNNRL
jgi:uncharacterized protein YbdZ (MbtH family)